MADPLSSITSAFAILKSLREISDKLRNAEMKGLIADLTVDLAEVKMKLAESMEENLELRNKIRQLDNPQFSPCPRCGKRSWHVAASRPDRDFGDMGGTVRTYRCEDCGLSEEKFVH